MQVCPLKSIVELVRLYGTNGLTAEHREAIRELKGLQEIIPFFDGDKAGSEAVEKYSKELKEQAPGITISNVNTPDNEDVNSLSIGHTEDIFFHLRLPWLCMLPSHPVDRGST